MNEELGVLDRLDRLDRDHVGRTARIVELEESRTAATTAVETQRAALTDAETQLADNLTEQRALNRKVEGYRRSLASAEGLLQTGQGDPEAAERQIVRCMELIDTVETETLELLEAQDLLQTAVDEARAAMAQAEAHHARLVASVPGEISEERTAIAALEAARPPLVAELPRDTASRYEHWRSRNKWAVSRIVRGACSACRMEVQPQHRADLRRGRIAPCRQCHRFLIPEAD